MTHGVGTGAAIARLTSLSVRDFRNVERLELDPPAEGMVVVGENGQGKTNVLEAIYYLELLRSVRGARDVDVVRFGADGFHLGAHVESDRASEVSVGFERAGRRKRVRIDGAVVDRLSDALGAVPAVMFSPGDVDLVAGAPGARRRFLDIMLALTSRGYLHALQRYRAALAHRNAALRQAARSGGGGPNGGVARSDAQIGVWEAPLAQHGAVIWRERREWVLRFSWRFREICEAIGESIPVSMEYVSTIPAAENASMVLARLLEEKRSLDLRRGVTHIGPHRDDVSFTLGTAARDLRSFGSAGQQRTAAIALRLLEAETFRERRERAPLFLLDDPFAELDERRSARIIELLERNGLGQTILAVPRESDVPRQLTDLARYTIRGGAIRPWGTA
jgi:DNA replication and repair protein RecF